MWGHGARGVRGATESRGHGEPGGPRRVREARGAREHQEPGGSWGAGGPQGVMGHGEPEGAQGAREMGSSVFQTLNQQAAAAAAKSL